MRMRHKKHGNERILACREFLIPTPDGTLVGPDRVQHTENTTYAIQPEEIFEKKQPVHLEIGCGKGGFSIETAKANPDVNLIAMERVPDVCCIALERAMTERYPENGEASMETLQNLRFLIGNAENLPLWLPPHSVDCIYLNFSDPWPKKGYAKRRLTYRKFLEIYRGLLVPGGILKLKTDNDLLFASSLEEFAISELEILWQTDDLHHSERAESNIMTEYEAHFASIGKNIHAADVRFPEKHA